MSEFGVIVSDYLIVIAVKITGVPVCYYDTIEEKLQWMRDEG